ncbi:diaminopimelate decarboxylase [Paenibacillus sp.]|jgi:diaminopimelate decarboxylase|uniref:diaminopimelate decarboxylase n=1 Tax=Paenibacillus sp. TaxID=58172 RepID=UPI002822F60F|nr:diaminopimelate decarboxylase [Paenibacillus sp.]MDR0267461.1 diaminopimelate decarboxylase [Paenibacillus sp.]
MIDATQPVLQIGEIPVTQLAREYGTTMYVYDAEEIEQKVNSFRQLMHKDVHLFYSLKANPNPTIVKWIYELGANLEICSPIELKVVKKLDIDPNRILYLGPGKTTAEIEEILDYGIKYFVLESMQEMEEVNRLAGLRNLHVEVGIRFNPNMSAKGSRLTMGGKPRQFGIDEDQAQQVFEFAETLSHLDIVGVHVYNGTRILSGDVVIENTKHVLTFVKQLYHTCHFSLKYVDIGGGLGIPYFKNEEELDFEYTASGIRSLIDEFHSEIGLNLPIFIESGRYVVGESGIYAASVLYTKESKSVHFATLDGGTNHHMAAGGMGNALKHNFPIRVLNKMTEPEVRPYHISGPLCTPNDVIAKHLSLPHIERGDLVGILSAGAYGLTSSPVLFLSHRLPVEVLVYKGQSILIRNRDEYEAPELRSLEAWLQEKQQLGGYS